MVTVEQVKSMFEALSKGDAATFVTNVEPNVDWTVKGELLDFGP